MAASRTMAPWTGRILHVDLSTGEQKLLPTLDLAGRFMGGRGAGGPAGLGLDPAWRRRVRSRESAHADARSAGRHAGAQLRARQRLWAQPASLSRRMVQPGEPWRALGRGTKVRRL